MDRFRDLYERYYRDVFRFALFLTGNLARAEDLTADTFVRVSPDLGTVRARLFAGRPVSSRDGSHARQPSPAKSLVMSIVFALVAFASTIGWLVSRRPAM
jgi:hypothetical protein